MQAHVWRLPGVQELTKDQEAALAYPAEGRHLIIGGPGTGKTVVMVMRAIRLRSQKVKHVFLVYNHMLHQASRQMGGKQFESCTYMSWLYKKLSHLTRESVPEHRPYYPDWEACIRKARAISPEYTSLNEKEFLIIDEGQDMAPGFYRTLICLGYRNIFVAADQNQQIRINENSSRQDLENELDIDTDRVIKLKRNFRNNYGIARLAREFYTGSVVNEPPQLPDRRGGIHIPKLYTYGSQPEIHILIARRIVRTFQTDRRKLLGVITPNNKVRKKYFDTLKEARNVLNENSLPIYTYPFEHRQEVRFNQGGIVVLNAKSCKGLEFDTAILADIHEHSIFRNDQDDTKKLFYVMVSRARDAVFLLMKRGEAQLIENLLPNNEEVLQRKKLGQ